MQYFLRELIYRTVVFCLRMCQPEFFRRVRLEGQPLDDPHQHLLVVANHPYGIQDAFLISLAYTRPFYFVATAMNFQRREGDRIKPRHLRGWFLRQCKVLPIVRNRSEGHMSENFQTFQTAAAQIAGGHALGIFAEGDSRGNQWGLLKLKSGAAQIALQVADLLRGRGSRLQVQVVGLTYTNWEQPFKSSVTLRFAAPFAVEPVDMDDRVALRSARKEITGRLTALMQAHTVQIPPEHRQLVGKIAQFYAVNRPSDYERLKLVAQHVEQLAERFQDERPELEQALDEYLQLADELQVYPGEERVRRHPLLLLAAALPAYAGYALHLPILLGTRWLVPREGTALHSLGDKRVTCAIVLTFVWYALLAAAAGWLCVWRWGPGGVSITIAIMLAVAACGLIASRTLRHVNLLLRSSLPSRRRFKRYRELSAKLHRRLEQYRASLA